MIRAGLTGGYGTGKSTVMRMFRSLGAPTMDADSIVSMLLAKDKSIIDAVGCAFGEDIVMQKGGVNKKKLADIVFQDAGELAKLTGILYPAVRKEIFRWFDETAGSGRYKAAIAEVSMLIEGGDLEMYDKIILVAANAEVQRRRCLAKGISESDFNRRIRNQMPLENKRRFANYIIENDESLEDTRKQATKIWNELNNEK